MILAVVVLPLVVRWINSWTMSSGADRRTFEPGTYAAATLMVNADEQLAWRVVEQLAAERGWRVLPKVRLADVVTVAGSPDRQRHFNHISSKHVDFVLADGRWRPRAVVEVDGGSHNAPRRQDRDRLVDDVLASAGIPVCHLRTGRQAGWPAQLRDELPLGAAQAR